MLLISRRFSKLNRKCLPRVWQWVQFHNPFKKGPDVRSGPLAFDVLRFGPSNSTIHAKNLTWAPGLWLSTSWGVARPTAQSMQKWARRRVRACGCRRVGACSVRFHNPFKKKSDVGSGLLIFDVLAFGPSNSTVHSKKGPTWGPGLWLSTS